MTDQKTPTNEVPLFPRPPMSAEDAYDSMSAEEAYAWWMEWLDDETAVLTDAAPTATEAAIVTATMTTLVVDRLEDVAASLRRIADALEATQR